MSGAEDVFRAMEERRPCAPQVRIYVLSEADLPTASLAAALPDYKVLLPHSKSEAALIRQMAVESDQEYRREAQRVAEVLAPILTADSYLSCVYDDRDCRTHFLLMAMRKTAGISSFIEMEAEQ